MRASVLILILAFGSTASAQQRTQVRFAEPNGMHVFWLTKENGKTVYSKVPLEVPGRFNFAQGAVYGLKLTRLPGHPGLELFPTLEVPAGIGPTRDFLAHNAVSIGLTDDEISQVVKGGFLVKVVYLPTGQAEPAATTGTDALNEAIRRGHVLLVLRVGNIDNGR